MQINESFRKLIPPLSSEEYAQLEENCKADGIRDPLVVWRGTLIDGHNRYDIAQKHGLDYTVVEKEFEDETAAKIWMVTNQFGRRNLNNYQRSVLALSMEELFKEKAKENQVRKPADSVRQNSAEQNEGTTPIETRKELAKLANVSHDTIMRVKKIEATATPETIAAVRSGEKSINEAYKEIKKVEIEAKRDEIRETLTAQYLETGEKKYRVIYADPPWSYGNNMPEYFTDAKDHYPAMSTIDICAMPINDICENDAVLFLWTTSPHLEETFEVIKAWGFKYKTSFVWDKVKHNMGHYNSVRHEFLLVCTKGSCVPDVKKLFDSVVTEERTTHSKKPETFREIIDTIYTDGNRIELFARNVNKEGWDVYGNQS